MSDPVMAAVATAVAAKTAEALSDAGRAALATLRDLIRQRLRARADTGAALTAVDCGSTDTAQVAPLRHALEQIAAYDPEFAEAVARLWYVVRTDPAQRNGTVTNQVSGSVSGTLVQARDVHGGISFGVVPASEHPTRP